MSKPETPNRVGSTALLDGDDPTALNTTDWSGCPKCGETHDDGSGETVGGKWTPYLDELGGSGFRLFRCKKCGQLLRDDISS